MICPRCRRVVEPWPLLRPDVCAPKGWRVCIRTYENIAKTPPPTRRRKAA